MKKNLLIFLLLGVCTIFLSWCTSQEEADNLKSDIAELESEVYNLKNTIEECSSSIEDAQSYAWADYEDMEYALENLQTCDYY